MAKGNATSAVQVVHWLIGHFRRPELMVFVPAVTLAAFWLGGERMLILTALGAPLLFALGGAFRFSSGAGGAVPDALTGLAMRPQIVSIMDEVLRDAPTNGMNTACIVVHAVSNLLLGWYVMQTQQWGFW